MTDEKPFTWIQTRDGSPTLWNNELGESFRSVKGAFTESWVAFIAPALAQTRGSEPLIEVGEFGLGAGTNWMLWTLAAPQHRYTAIERDVRAFEMGRARWIESAPLLAAFLAERGLPRTEELIRATLMEAPMPRIFASIDEAVRAGARFDVWFHDPFGFDVNPEGYSPQTLSECAKLWKKGAWGGSYACNSKFRKSLEALAGLSVRVVPTGDAALKRERLEFTLL